MFKNRLIIFFVCMFCQLYSQSACIIIHGTWARNETWYQQHGDFFKSVQRCVQELQCVDEIISFSWSGKLSFQAQQEAAQNLVCLVDQYDFVILIGHSHGGTVGIIASQILGQKNKNSKNSSKIKKFYGLAVPVDFEKQIYPDMCVIEHVYHLFSFGDYIQPANDLYARVFAKHERIANIAVTIDDLHPSHSGMHSPVIGKELLKIADLLANKFLGNFEKFSFGQDGVIRFNEYDLPKYEIEYDLMQRLEMDKKARWLMNYVLFRSASDNKTHDTK